MASYFSYNVSRKYIVSMMKMFNNVRTQRMVDNEIIENKVPVVWGSKERNVMINDDAYQVGLTARLPRMALTLDGLQYDAARKINRLAKRVTKLSEITNAEQYPPVPYNYEFTLHIMTKTIDDYFQIIEQIVPFFNPVRNIDVVEIPGTEPSSIKVSIGNIQFEPDMDYEQMGDMRLVKGSISFILQGNVYIPIRTTNTIINEIFVRYYSTLKTDQDNFDEFLISDQDADPTDIEVTMTHAAGVPVIP
jgi:hypothetical protein